MVDWQQGFTTAFRQFSTPSADTEVLAISPSCGASCRDPRSSYSVPRHALGYAVWDGALDQITRPLLVEAVRNDPDLPVELAGRVLQLVESEHH